MKRLYRLIIAAVACLIVAAVACTPEVVQPEENTQEETVEPQTPEENNNEEPGDDNTQPQNNNEDQGGQTTPDENGNEPGSENNGENNEDYPDVQIAALPVLSPSVREEKGAISLSEEAREYSKAANRFAFNLLPTLYEGASFASSPLSIQMALSMVADGAAGQTLVEMLNTLGFPSTDGMNEYGKAIVEQLPAVDLSVSLQLANTMIVNEMYPVKESYVEQIGAYYYAPVANMTFANPAKVREVVNDWCSKNTNGIIPSILEAPYPDSKTMAYLLNALYFKAAWTNPYDPGYQVWKNRPFKAAGGDASVDYLISQENLRYSDNGSFRVAWRPMGEDGLYDFAVLLPKEDDGLAGLLQMLPSVDWSEMQSSAGYQELIMTIPAFDVSGSFDLVNNLFSLGMERAFMDDIAEFPNMFDGASSCISKVLHKARIILGDGGIEAASITSVEMYDTMEGPGEETPQPVEFYADHPFVFVITERGSGTILFAGVYDGK